MPYRDRRERRHERRRGDSRERPEDKGKTDEGKKESREARKDSDKTRVVKHSKTSKYRSRSRDNDSEQEDARAERTDRFKSERFAEDRSVLTTSSRRNDREFRSNRMGQPRDGRRPGGRRERRYDHQERNYDRQDEDYDMSKVTERFANPTYVPKDSRYFLHDDREMTNTRRRNMQRARSPLKWEHDLFQDKEIKEQEEMAVIDNEDDNMKWRSVVQVPMGSTGFGPQYDNFYHQYQRQQDGRWMHDKYFEMERETADATR